MKYLIILWGTVTLYTLSPVFTGDSGLPAYHELSIERDKQKLTIETLKEKNRELEGFRDALLYDSDTVAVYARELGFGRDDEVFIRIVGFDERLKQPIAPGEVTRVLRKAHTADRLLRIITFCTGMGSIILVGIFDFLRRRPNGRI
ncbi:MAG: septum formation initiator family protein [Spirochaetaceae bacterium]|jgi:cell division protein FtsB|nr:septum formation initiator family protein [Spirochaetaceae bacterium]